MPQIAAIIPVFNRPRHVIEALQSIADQSRPPDQVIVVDDGSTDDTPERVGEYLQRAPFRGTLVRQENAGASAARNRGAAEAPDAEVLAFLDSDDLWPDDYLARVDTRMRSDSSAVAATADLHHDDGGGRTVLRGDWSHVSDHSTRRFFARPPGTPNTVFRRQSFEAVGGFDEALKCGEDYHLALRVSLLGPWLYLPGAPVIARRVDGGKTGEAGSLSRVYPDGRYQLAMMLERFIEQEGGREHLEDSEWKPQLARAWFTGGRQLRRLGRHDEANECMRKALMLNPLLIRARWETIVAPWRSATTSGI